MLMYQIGGEKRTEEEKGVVFFWRGVISIVSWAGHRITTERETSLTSRFLSFYNVHIAVAIKFKKVN